jgi:hypothetical protein
MNERIKELALQANGPNPFYGTLKNQMTLLGDDAVKKFAELIVRECMNIAYEYDAPKLSGPGMIIANRIESHFGVEE